MALADTCDARMSDPALPEALQQRVCIELSCAWADTQKLRARDAAERALHLARRLQREPAHDDDRFMLYHALCRLASARRAGGRNARRASAVG